MNQPPNLPETVTPQAAALRQRAEQTQEVTALATEDLAALSPESIRRIFHELQVHQIEPKMQNEELRRTQEQLAASHTCFFDFYELAPVGYVTVSKTGLILEANLAAAALLGIARCDMIRQSVNRFIFRDHRARYFLYHSRLIATGMPQAGELRMLDKNGVPCWVFLSASLAHDEEGRPLCRVVLTDITVRKRAEESLRQSHEELARFNGFMVGRELRMLELKREINALCALAGEPPRYQVEDLK